MKNINEKYIEGLEDIKNRNSITIDKLEILLSEMKEEQEQLIHTLMDLKSKIKNDEVIK